MSLKSLIITYQQQVDNALNIFLPSADTKPTNLHKAMRYAVYNGGKRIRPILVYLTGAALNVQPKQLDIPACAVELIHAYSLIHDDLPAMDDDDLRRGKPTCHKAFDEATAILAGDALQTLAFYIISHTKNTMMVETLANGSLGMVDGQAIDIDSTGQSLNLEELENLHNNKTGALIKASVKLGALSCTDIDSEKLQKLDNYAKCIGLAFQIQDDILDVEATTEILGKAQGSDIANNKVTYPSLLGMKASKQMANDLIAEALTSLTDFGEPAEPLRWMANYIITRCY
ncbi:polyprenyl synthetase family protein [Candidatus Halobeggiatoa sp. HSG11]|nr:polyprenyl synthetase family protein [Candidatus Halobeggiatoa sp. HSG11]